MTQLELKLANSNSGSCRTIYTEHNTRRLFWRHMSRRFSSAVCWWRSPAAHARM